MALPQDVVEAIDRQVDALRDSLVEQTSQLVRIPTVNPYSGDSSAGRETEGQRYMAGLLQKMGAKVRQIQVPDDVFARCNVIGPTPRDYKDRFNVAGEFAFGSGGKSVLLNCHMDTVGTEGYQGNPYGGEVLDGKIFGRGSTDSKGNLMVGLFAIEALRQAGVPLTGRVILESVVDEECNGSGGGTLANRLAGINTDACICLDGAGLYPCIGCNGVATAAVDVFGRAGHAATGAVNAIDKAVQVKLSIDQMARQREAMQPKQLMNLGIFRAGTLPAVVPHQAHLEYNINYALSEAQAAKDAGKGWGAEWVRQQFELAVQAPAKDDPWLAEHPSKVLWIKDLYPFLTSVDQPIVQAARLAYQTVLRQDRQPAPMGAWFDGAHIAIYAGIPTVGMGAGTMAAAHTSLEHISIDDMVADTKAVALAIYAFLMNAA